MLTVQINQYRAVNCQKEVKSDQAQNIWLDAFKFSPPYSASKRPNSFEDAVAFGQVLAEGSFQIYLYMDSEF